MSISYKLNKRIEIDEIFSGALESFGIIEQHAADRTRYARCLTDGRSFLWVYGWDGTDGEPNVSLTRWAGNFPHLILKAIAVAFDTEIFSEHQPQYWGFDTQEEWDAHQEVIGKNNAMRSMRT